MKRYRLFAWMLFGLALCSCALMKNIEDAHASRDVQKGLRELGSYVDVLKAQAEGRYTYRILAANAGDMQVVCESLSGKALDSYFRKLVRDIGRLSAQLHDAADRKDAAGVGACMEDIIRTWEIVQEYKRP